MKTLVVSWTNLKYDGRTRSLIDVFGSFSDLIVISGTNGSTELTSKGITINNENYFQFVREAINYCKRLNTVDCMLIDNRRAIIPANKIRRMLSPKVTVYDARELYIKKEMKTLSSKIVCDFEKRMIKSADCVICANEERRSIMHEIYGDEIKIFVFDNFRKLEYSSSVNFTELSTKFDYLFIADKFKIVSSAGCNINRDTIKLVKAVNELQNNCLLFLVGCVDGKDKNTITSLIHEIGATNIVLIPKVDSDSLKYILSNSDIGVAMYNKVDTNNYYCSSGKVFEYAYEGIPVAASDNPPLRRTVEKYGIGECDEEIGKAILKICNDYSRYKINVQNFIYSRVVEKEAAKFTSLMKDFIFQKLQTN